MPGPNQPRSALVIGGTGVSGYLTVAALVAKGWAVTILHTGIHKPSEKVAWYYDGSVRIVLANPFKIESLRATIFHEYGESFYWDLVEYAQCAHCHGVCAVVPPQ